MSYSLYTPYESDEATNPRSSSQEAIVITKAGPPEQLHIATIPIPKLTNPLDILVKVKAAGTNPVDTKVRQGAKNHDGLLKEGEALVIGYDASGIVVEVGSSVVSFKPGDEVYYAGHHERAGSYQQFELVDYRIVSKKPQTIDFAQAAALPLTTITAWEAMVEHLNVKKGKTILIMAGGGGVGSIAIQLAKYWGLKVITSSSRSETSSWAKKMGADFIIDHSKGVSLEFDKYKLDKVDYVLNTASASLLSDLLKVVKPVGSICCITPDISPNDIAAVIATAFKNRIALHFEYMFCRSTTNTEPEKQGMILESLREIIDKGQIQSTLNRVVSWKQVVSVHKELESGKTIGKTVLIIDANQ